MSPLIDGFGRIHKDLRISVTDRCNFRCQYCMPAEGMVWLERSKVLNFDEINRIVGVMVRHFGLESIRLTGGEPTLRSQLHRLVSMLSVHDVDLSMTTNGVLLPAQAEDLYAAGLRRINVSLDTLDRERFSDLVRRDKLEAVLEGIAAAVETGFDPVKVNVMLMRGINDDEIVSFLEFGRSAGVVIRFIEFMPLDAQEEWSSERVVTADEILDTAAQVYEFSEIDRGSSPAKRFSFDDGQGEFGVINSVSEPFCSACDRVRLTAEGQMRNCLFALEHVDLRALLRSGATDEDIASAISGEVQRKRSGHAIGQVHFVRPTKSMSQVGG